MQIVTTVEELREHQKLTRKWAGDAALHQIELLKGHGDPTRFRNIHEFLQHADAAIDEWEKKNPFPRFIPSV
jgi:hypothetical protein